MDCPDDLTDVTIAECVGDPSHLVLLYRIVLEAIINARKHSRGTVIGVSLRTPGPGALEIAIQDNGVGNGGPFGENAGMSLMRRRAEEIGAGIEYGATPGGGTTVVVRLARPRAADVERGNSDSTAVRAVL
jgi:two-component system nitrate/nitrite sensor histidine kinase NarQ